MIDYYLTLIIFLGTPIAIGTSFIFIAFSARKKRRIISILSILVISFALVVYIIYISYFIYISKYCKHCHHLLRSEHNRVLEAFHSYDNLDYLFSGKLPTLSDLIESGGYSPPEDKKLSFINPCIHRSDLSVIISGAYPDIKILVYAKEGMCGKLAYVGEFLRYEEVCAYLYGDDPRYNDDCNEELWMIE